MYNAFSVFKHPIYFSLFYPPLFSSALLLYTPGLPAEDACCVCSFPHQPSPERGGFSGGGTQLPWREVHKNCSSEVRGEGVHYQDQGRDPAGGK